MNTGGDMPTNKQRIVRQRASEGKSIRADESTSTNEKRPLFALHQMIPPACGESDRAQLFDHFRDWSSLTWNQIRADKHEGYGLERIPIEDFRRQIQNAVTPDVNHLMVGRYSQVGRFAGYPINEVFFVIVLDHDHTAY